MKTFLLIITILFLISRMSETLRYISKKEYEKYIKKEVNKLSVTYSKYSVKEVKELKNLTCICAILFYLFMSLYYLYIGNKFSNEIIYFLSILEVVTLGVHIWRDFFETNLSLKEEDYIFHRWYFLFNVILDYIYYPMVIYLLLK